MSANPSRMVRAGPRRRLAPRIALLLVTTALLLAGTECVVNWICPDRHNVWPSHFDARLGPITDAGATVRWAGGVGRMEFDVESLANSIGFLDAEPPTGPKRERRVVLLGDSFVEALQVPLEERMGRRLENLLSASAPTRVIALGRSSTGPAQQWAYLEHVGLPLDPDVVISIVINNDLENDSPELESALQGWDPDHQPYETFVLGSDGRASPRPPDPDYEKFLVQRATDGTGDGFLAGLVPRIKRHSKAFSLAVRSIQGIRWWNEHYATPSWAWEGGLAFDFHFYRPVAELSPRFTRAIALSDAVVGYYAEQLRTRRIRWIVAFVPTVRDSDDASREICGYRVDPTGQRSLWKGFCSRRGVEFVDLTGPLSANPDGNPRRHLFAGDGHLNPSGHAAVAEALAGIVKNGN